MRSTPRPAATDSVQPLAGQASAAAPAADARRVRVWHFVVFPALAMGAALLLSRLLEIVLPVDFVGSGAYQAARPIVISVAMASLIGWLAVGYRSQYEARLETRNKALEETRDFLHSIIEACGEAIVTLDADERITSWNPAAERIFGWTSTEMVGRSYESLLPEDSRIVDERRSVSLAIREGRTVRDHQTTRIHRDGTPVRVRVTWSPLYDRTGRHAGATAIVLDVTTESEMKQRLVEQERLAAVGELAAQVAHEVRNPLAGIRGACEVILAGKQEPSVRQEVGAEILRQIDRLNRTVGDLLTFARPREVDAQPTELNKLIRRVVGVFAEDPLTRSVEIDYRLAADLPPIGVDRGQMEQVFYNLLLNAAQVMDYEGTITISTALEQDDVSVSVRDSGPGIPPEVAPNIFKPFFSTRSQGTGLGLTIVKKIVAAHRGAIEASSSAEGGAEFCIRLPVGEPHSDRRKAVRGS